MKYDCSGDAETWQVRKQQTVAFSSSEAEYQGLAAAAQEILFLRQLSQDLFCEQELAALNESNCESYLSQKNSVFLNILLLLNVFCEMLFKM